MMAHPADMQLIVSLAAVPGTAGYTMHNAGYKALGINALYLPRRYQGDIGQALAAIRTLGIRGASLTMPFKCSCLVHLDHLSAEAKAIGSVNTVVNDNGTLTGYNTDAPAAEQLITRALPWQDNAWIILGTGGMAHALAYVAQKLKVKAYVCARNTEKSARLAKRFDLNVMAWEDTQLLKGAVVFNATPVGMKGSSDQRWYFEEIVPSLAGVFDAVASPATTALVGAARAGHIPVVSGDTLSLEQACLQFELYTGQPAPRDAMEQSLRG